MTPSSFRRGESAAGDALISRTLKDLFSDAAIPPQAESLAISAVTADSRQVSPGSLFVAIRGTRTDGHGYVSEAIRRGASAILVEAEFRADGGVPVIRVNDTRRALAEIAASFYGEPGSRLLLVGITGTVGKTTILTMLESILTAARGPIGVIGSLGLRIGRKTVKDTGVTSPDPVELHRGLARIADSGCDLVAMEVTSHALVQRRVHGLEFDLGVFTNLIPLEHADFHGTFGKYVQAKRGFLELLHRPCAPLVFNADDRTVRRIVHHPLAEPVSCGLARTAVARIEACSTSIEGTQLSLNIRRPLPMVGGGEVAPAEIPLRLRLLGRSNVSNAALSATAALCLGVPAGSIVETLASFPPPRRRMEILHRAEFTVIDDTIGHPDSVSALFEIVEKLAPRRVHVAIAVRGCRGVRINEHVGKSLAIWSERVPLATIVVTRSTEATNETNRVTDREAAAFREALRENAVRFVERNRLDEAVSSVLEVAGEGDLVLLLGAQGMDAGRETARRWLQAHAKV